MSEHQSNLTRLTLTPYRDVEIEAFMFTEPVRYHWMDCWNSQYQLSIDDGVWHTGVTKYFFKGDAALETERCARAYIDTYLDGIHNDPA